MNTKRLKYNQTQFFIGTVLSLLVAYISGWREDGIDRKNYVEMFKQASQISDFESQIFYAKDLMFLGIATATSAYENGDKITFSIFTILGILTKFYFSFKVSSDRLLLFLISYFVFLAPGLEFAAIRAGASIGFLFLAILYQDKIWLFVLFGFLGITVHFSIIFPLFIAVRPINLFLSKNLFSNLIITIVAIAVGDILFATFSRGSVYIGDQGSKFAYLEPLITLLCVYLLSIQTSGVDTYNHLKQIVVINRLQSVVVSLIFLSFGIIRVSVTSSTRYLEIAWCLMLFTCISMRKLKLVNVLGVIIFVTMLIFINIRRSTWVSVFYPELF